MCAPNRIKKHKSLSTLCQHNQNNVRDQSAVPNAFKLRASTYSTPRGPLSIAHPYGALDTPHGAPRLLMHATHTRDSVSCAHHRIVCARPTNKLCPRL